MSDILETQKAVLSLRLKRNLRQIELIENQIDLTIDDGQKFILREKADILWAEASELEKKIEKYDLLLPNSKENIIPTEISPLIKPAQSVFLAYAPEDLQTATMLANYLTQVGFKVYENSQEFLSADRLIVILSPHSMPYNKKVHREWEEFDNAGKPLHPFYIQKCEIHNRLFVYNYIDARLSWSDGLKLLTSALKAPFQPVEQIHPRDRITVISGEQNTEDIHNKFREILRSIVIEESRSTITESQIRQLGQLSPRDFTEYKIGRIAEWSQRRYQLNNRFVHLTLLLDQGEQNQGLRWIPASDMEEFNDLRDVLSNVDEPAIVVLGSPGSGKSTLLRRLQLDISIDDLQGKSDNVVFFVQLNQYRAKGLNSPLPSPYEWLCEKWNSRFHKLPHLEELINSGRVLFLLDALNEMPHINSFDYREKINLWRQFLTDYIRDKPGNKAVFSCRSLDYSASLSTTALRVPQVVVQPMNPAQIKEFITLHTPAYFDLIWNSLKNTTQLSLFSTPYFLILLIDQVEYAKHIPSGQAELFTGFVRHSLYRELQADNKHFHNNTVLTERDLNQISLSKWAGPHGLPDRGMLIPKLSELAYKMQESRTGTDGIQVRLSYTDAQKIINHTHADEIIKAGIDLNVLDDDVAHEEVLFFHQLIQEYFAARSLAKNPTPQLVRKPWHKDQVQPHLQDILKYIADSDPLPHLPTTGWEETTVLAAAMSDNRNSFVSSLISVNLSLAGRCASIPNLSIDQDIQTKIQMLLLDRTLNHEADLRSRIEAGLTLGLLGDPRFNLSHGKDQNILLPIMVEIPAGNYFIGENQLSDNDNQELYRQLVITSYNPRTDLFVEPFSLGKYPVRNAEFAKFIESGGYEDIRWWQTKDAKNWQNGDGTAAGPMQDYWFLWRTLRQNFYQIEKSLESERITKNQAKQWTEIAQMTQQQLDDYLTEKYKPGKLRLPRFWNDEAYNNPNQPVVGICWHEAQAYCLWLSYQTGQFFDLPTEAEWEIAAKGFEQKVYPYGNEFNWELGNVYETHIRRTTPVGIFPGCASEFGCMDMSGNVWEWTNSAAQNYPYNPLDGREDINSSNVRRICRGGSWDFIGENASTFARHARSASSRTNYIGFRLCLRVKSRYQHIPKEV